ncbi:hypothetical protein LSTR_LSTR001131 [Laodelphax striatellus]|uniref:Uncharacterized protein n=1 Tax=Laodelphax striatellus TaxID=195883 RepID=A0A482X2J2_LAOST|nr:hypothetical protein LSTR_LSTR001131 [Laodelphax striatellus]
MASTTATTSKPKMDFIYPKKSAKLDQAKFDGKFKEMIRMQEIASNGWFEKWGFMTKDAVEKIYEEEAEQRGLDKDFMKKRRMRSDNKITEETKFTPKSGPVPDLSSGMVGWRSSDIKYNLEKVGPLYVSPRRYMDPPLRPQDIDLRHQKFIFLG